MEWRKKSHAGKRKVYVFYGKRGMHDCKFYVKARVK
jgi:hypothetical protein